MRRKETQHKADKQPSKIVKQDREVAIDLENPPLSPILLGVVIFRVRLFYVHLIPQPYKVNALSKQRKANVLEVGYNFCLNFITLYLIHDHL